MPRLTRFHRIVLCGGLAALFYLAGLGGPALWEPDEGRYAEVARAMVASGDYVTPRDNGVRYFEKPPLVYWAGALAIRMLGRNELAVRLPAALASAGSVAVTALAGELMLGPAVGMLAALALGLSPLFGIFARVATPDPELAFFFSAGMLAFFAAAARDWRTGAGRGLMLAAAGLLGLATMVKGPVALALGGAIGLGWLVAEGRARDALRIRWLECGALYLAITLPWFVLAARRNPGFLAFFFIHEHVQRFVSDNEHGWGPWFFLPIAVIGTWPFFYFVPAGAIALRAAPAGEDPARRRGVRRFLWLWFGVVLVFFSLPRAKLAEYLLPGLPPLALIAAAGLARLRTMAPGDAARRGRGLAGINAAAGLAGLVSCVLLRRYGAASLARVGLPLALLLTAAGLLGWLRAPAPRAIPGAVGLLALLIAILLVKARSDLTPLNSYRELARVITPSLERGCVLASYHHFVQGLPFYTGRQEKLVGYRGELAPFGDSPDATAAFIPTDRRLQAAWAAPSCMVLVANRVDWPRLAATLKPAPVLLGCQGKKVALGNAPPAPGPFAAPGLAAACGSYSPP